MMFTSEDYISVNKDINNFNSLLGQRFLSQMNACFTYLIESPHWGFSGTITLKFTNYNTTINLDIKMMKIILILN